MSSSPSSESRAPRPRRRLVPLLAGAIVLVALAAAAALARHWEALAARSWPDHLTSLAFTDDGRCLVALDREGGVHYEDLENPLDRTWGFRRALSLAPGATIARALSAERVLVGWALPEKGAPDSWKEHEALSLRLSPPEKTRLGRFRPIDASTETDVLVTEERSPANGEGLTCARRLSRPGEVLWSHASGATLETSWGDLVLRASVALSPHGEAVAESRHDDDSLTFRDARTGAVTASASSWHPLWIAFDGTEELLEVARRDDAHVTRWARSGHPRGYFETPIDLVIGVAPGAPRAIKGGVAMDPWRIVVLDSRTGDELVTQKARSVVCALSRDGTRLAFLGARHLEVVRVP